MKISNLSFLRFKILFIFFLSLPTIFWASDGYMINGGDINYPLILENNSLYVLIVGMTSFFLETIEV